MPKSSRAPAVLVAKGLTVREAAVRLKDRQDRALRSPPGRQRRNQFPIARSSVLKRSASSFRKQITFRSAKRQLSLAFSFCEPG